MAEGGGRHEQAGRPDVLEAVAQAFSPISLSCPCVHLPLKRLEKDREISSTSTARLPESIREIGACRPQRRLIQDHQDTNCTFDVMATCG